MAKYKPRKDGKFLTHVTVPGKKNDDGSSVRVIVWADSSRELETKIGEVKSQLKVGTYADDCGLSFGDYSKKWLSTYKENVVSTKTFFKYRTIVNSHFEILNTIRLRDIGKSDIQSQLNKYPNSYDTRRMILLTARQVLDCAIDDGLLYRNVALKVTVKKPIGSKSNRRPLSENEKAAIRQLIDSGMFTSMERFYINTLLCTGCRPSEALALC